ncbi:putative integrase catalytic subunit [Burkholderia pseudomallei TSV28]|nr:putative integrase catalytic subunit [Burkholderia pseudomallei TSV28]
MLLPQSRSWFKRTLLEAGWPYRRGQVRLAGPAEGNLDLVMVSPQVHNLTRKFRAVVTKQRAGVNTFITSCLMLVKNTVLCLPASLSERLCPVFQGAAPSGNQITFACPHE